MAEVDLSRTVGWFTTIFPVYLDLRAADRPGEVLKSIKEQLRQIPNQGIGYGLLRYLSEDSAIVSQLRARPQAEISFNYLGQFDQVLAEPSLFRLAHESSGPDHSPRGQRRYVLEVEGSITAGRLHLVWTYSENIHRRSTIERLANDFITALRALISHTQSPEAGGYTPSDFPEANLSQAELDDLLAELSETME
jgi:non-ribosomal peptide synthase protein (TIGR01720 family)